MAQQERVVVDFDHHSPEVSAHTNEVLGEMARKCPVAWTEAHGGYWVVSGYEALAEASRDDKRFSSRHDVTDPDSPYQGITQPSSSPYASGFIEMDPPDFLKHRRLFNPWFSPAAVERWRPKIVDLTTAFIDRVIDKGECDFIEDIASPVPAVLTMLLMGIPVHHWKTFADAAHHGLAYAPGTAEYDRGVAEFLAAIDTIQGMIVERQQDPKDNDDLISFMIGSQIDGRPMTFEELLGNCILTYTGGVDTTTSLLTNAVKWLDQHPAERELLRNDPSRIPLACEEFLRVFTPVTALARTCTGATTLGGQHLEEGDRVLLTWAAANLDPVLFDHPDEVILDRFPNRHAAFGLGAHRCIGSNFARTQFAIVLGQVLERMPDYVVHHDRAERYPSIAVNPGWVKLPMSFTPGPIRGSDFRP